MSTTKAELKTEFLDFKEIYDPVTDEFDQTYAFILSYKNDMKTYQFLSKSDPNAKTYIFPLHLKKFGYCGEKDVLKSMTLYKFIELITNEKKKDKMLKALSNHPDALTHLLKRFEKEYPKHKELDIFRKKLGFLRCLHGSLHDFKLVLTHDPLIYYINNYYE